MASTIREHLTCRESAIAKVGKQGRDNSVKLTVSIQVTRNISFIMHTEKEDYNGTCTMICFMQSFAPCFSSFAVLLHVVKYSMMFDICLRLRDALACDQAIKWT